MQGSVVLGIPSSVQSIIQDGLIERAFHDALFPAMMYRAEAQFMPWEANTGTETLMTRAGTLAPTTTPTPAGEDPVPQASTYEQWVARLDRYTGTIDTYMPNSAFAAADLFFRNVQNLGMMAGQSLNRIPRNAMFRAYISGQTCTTGANVSGDTVIHVAAINGFTDVLGNANSNQNVRPVPVSPSNPLPVTITGIGIRQVIGASPDNPADPIGPGTITISVSLGAGTTARTSVVSSVAPTVIRSGGGDSVDALGASDTFTLQDFINAVGVLRSNNVQPHDDGFYHAHISTSGNTQIFADPVFQRLQQSLPEGYPYAKAFIGTIGNGLFTLNNESPTKGNSGNLTSTGANSSQYASDIGGEVTNDAGIAVQRILVTGKAGLYELGFDESKYVSEAGITGKTGDFDVVNNGIAIDTSRIRLILRAPQNRMQDIVAASWSLTGGWPVPTDITASSSPSRYKRMVVIESAG